MSFYNHIKKITPPWVKYPLRILRSSDFRSAEFNKIFKPHDTHQTTTFTSFDRYPHIFSVCREYFSNKGFAPRILSFGCSTGEELLSLRKYFPESEIVGVDINEWCLRQCRKKINDQKTMVYLSSTKNIEKYGPYDLVFCLAVFQRTPVHVLEQKVTNLTALYPFSRFESKLIRLNRSIVPGGLFVLQYAQYRFMDTVLKNEYSPYSQLSDQTPDYVVFDKNGDLLGKIVTPSIYIKDNNRVTF